MGKNKKNRITAYVFILYLVLLFISLLAITSSSAELDMISRSSIPIIVKQIILITISIFTVVLFITENKLAIKFIYNTANLWFFGVLILIFLTTLLGKETNEARRSLVIPHLGISLNTFEFGKLAVVIFLAKTLTQKYNSEEQRKRTIYKNLLWILLMIGIIALQNLSTAIILGLVSLIMLSLVDLSEDMKKKITYVIIALSFLGLIIIAFHPINIGRSTTWRSRIVKFVTNSYKPTDQGFLTKIAVARTGPLHFKPGSSHYKYIIPLAYTDYIFAIIAEEMAPVALIIPFLYIILLYLFTKIAFRQKKPFNMLMILGFGSTITLQALIHIFVNTGWMIETGQTLPFISLGGVSLLVNSIMLGLILAAHKYSLNPQTQSQTNANETGTDFNDIIIDDNIITTI